MVSSAYLRLLIFLLAILTYFIAAAAAKSLQLCPTLCDPIDGSPRGSSVPGILQTRTLEWVAISFSNVQCMKVKNESAVAQSCQTLSDPMDCSPPGSSVHGIFQARVLELVAITFSYRVLILAVPCNCVDHNKLWKILQEMGISDHLTCLLRNLYAGQEATIRTGYGITDWLQIGKGIHQDCI